ncbi:MAG: PHP domain-containing protein [Eubacteriales bacterium]|nr:PHP domain-containing protein [Eubacteriales bacterium]
MHSCLSPCGDMDMTPNNIVGMSKLLGLNIIALTDHNSVLNCEAVMQLGEENNLLVIPGMELTTQEEIHVVCLFPTLEKALEWNDYVKEHQMQFKNRTDIYGRQVIMDKDDNEIGEVENLLILATDISVMDVKSLVESFSGVCYPAHINRDSMSIISSLGDIPTECGFRCAEVSSSGDIDKLKAMYPILNDMLIVRDSDAHYLENMKDAENFFELDELTIESVLNKLNNN